MPHHKSCKKRLRQADKATAANRAVRSAIRTSLKTIRTTDSKEVALKETPRLFSLMDKAALKGRAGFTRNRVANYKAKIAKVLAALG